MGCWTLVRAPEMKEILSQLARFAKQRSVSFGAFDPTPLFAGATYQFAPSVSEFFSTAIPSTKLDLGLYRICSAIDISAENQEFIPSCHCAPHGFVTIATELSGDAFSIDVTDGNVYQISHEKYEADGIEPGWNADCTAFLPTLPLTRENIINTSEGYWDSITDFLQECLDYAIANA
jgi:hypothetical protein